MAVLAALILKAELREYRVYKFTNEIESSLHIEQIPHIYQLKYT